ncbi:hypothetical protein AB4Y72_02145 [Arthrobacter sp. YAF34]
MTCADLQLAVYASASARARRGAKGRKSPQAAHGARMTLTSRCTRARPSR